MEQTDIATLRYRLAYQTAGERDPLLVSTWGLGECGHMARGCGICADCLRDEIGRREQDGGRE